MLRARGGDARAVPESPHVPSAFALWLEEALKSWVLQVAAIGVVVAVAAPVAAAAAADARLGSRSEAAVPVAMTLAFGQLVDRNATPFSAVGPALGGVLLGAMLGALAGALASRLGRRLLPAGWRRGKRG